MRWNLKRLELYRVRAGQWASRPGDTYGGAFIMQGPCGQELTIIADDGSSDGALGGWEHVSVSGLRIPNWEEMCFVKNLFWAPEECVVQFHPPESEHVNNHPRCLHLWRPLRDRMPTPPDILVGYKELGNLEKTATSVPIAYSRKMR